MCEGLFMGGSFAHKCIYVNEYLENGGQSALRQQRALIWGSDKVCNKTNTIHSYRMSTEGTGM